MATMTGKLLTKDERELCRKIAELKIVLVSRRAKALLMLDDGHTQVKSAELSSLTLGQFRYLLRLFKKKRMNLFPKATLPQQEEPSLETTPSSIPEISGKNPAEDITEKKRDKKKKKSKKSASKKKKRKKEEKKKAKQPKEKKSQKRKKKR